MKKAILLKVLILAYFLPRCQSDYSNYKFCLNQQKQLSCVTTNGYSIMFTNAYPNEILFPDSSLKFDSKNNVFSILSTLPRINPLYNKIQIKIADKVEIVNARTRIAVDSIVPNESDRNGTFLHMTELDGFFFSVSFKDGQVSQIGFQEKEYRFTIFVSKLRNNYLTDILIENIDQESSLHLSYKDQKLKRIGIQDDVREIGVAFWLNRKRFYVDKAEAEYIKAEGGVYFNSSFKMLFAENGKAKKIRGFRPTTCFCK